MEAFEWLCSVQYQKFVFNRPTTAKLHPRQRILDGLHFKYILFLRNIRLFGRNRLVLMMMTADRCKGQSVWPGLLSQIQLFSKQTAFWTSHLYVQCVLNTVQCKLNVYVACTLCNAHCTLRTAVEMCRVGRRGCTSMSGQSQPQVRACPSLHCSAQFCI